MMARIYYSPEGNLVDYHDTHCEAQRYLHIFQLARKKTKWQYQRKGSISRKHGMNSVRCMLLPSFISLASPSQEHRFYRAKTETHPLLKPYRCLFFVLFSIFYASCFTFSFFILRAFGGGYSLSSSLTFCLAHAVFCPSPFGAESRSETIPPVSSSFATRFLKVLQRHCAPCMEMLSSAAMRAQLSCEGVSTYRALASLHTGNGMGVTDQLWVDVFQHAVKEFLVLREHCVCSLVVKLDC